MEMDFSPMDIPGIFPWRTWSQRRIKITRPRPDSEWYHQDGKTLDTRAQK